MFKNKKTLYWSLQLAGWALYALMLLLFFNYTNQARSILFLLVCSTFIIGISLSHFFKLLILKLNWLKLGIITILPRLFLISLISGSLFAIVLGGISDVFFPIITGVFTYPFKQLFYWSISFTPIFLIWNTIYFAVHYFSNYKIAEIRNLKLKASQTEIELQNLKSQLNPHFMFNSMNSIIALIDEDPNIAKVAITKLSNLLRSSLIIGKKKLITLEEELKIVHDYIALEKIRFEERLNYSNEIAPESLKCMIPPLMLQTIVENAVKHGIASLPKGGEICIKTNITGNKLNIIVENSGNLNFTKKTGTNIGLKNTKKRLNLLYKNDAHFLLSQFSENIVAAHLTIPKNT